MTILHSGASRKFADNWLKIFGGPKSTRTVKVKSPGKKASRPPSPGRPRKKQVTGGRTVDRAKKKPSGKKSSG
jgi:hypothetical protein